MSPSPRGGGWAGVSPGATLVGSFVPWAGLFPGSHLYKEQTLCWVPRCKIEKALPGPAFRKLIDVQGVTRRGREEAFPHRLDRASGLSTSGPGHGGEDDFGADLPSWPLNRCSYPAPDLDRPVPGEALVFPVG